MADRSYLERMTRELAESGKLIEAGWYGLRLAAIPLNASAVQLSEMRMAFFAGAQHLFGALTHGEGMLDPEHEPTDGDLRRMDLIDAELREFIKDFEIRNVPTKGTA